MVLALARPIWFIAGEKIRLDSMAIQIVVDTSGSMGEAGESGISRLDAGVRAIHQFLGQPAPGMPFHYSRANDLVGLISFAARPKVEVPLTFDHQALLAKLRRLAPKQIPGESETNLPDALILAMDQCKSAQGIPKVLLLLTDGENNVPNPVSGYTALEAASLACAAGFRIHVVDAGAFGLQEGPIEHSRREKAARHLQSLAERTQGLYFPAASSEAFSQAFAKIHEKEKSPIDTALFNPRVELYQWLAGLSLVLLFSSVFLSGSPWRQLP